MDLSRRGLLVLVAAVVTAALTARLGFWQLDRAAQKIRAQQTQDSRRALPPLALQELPRDAAAVPAQLQRQVLLQGQWQPELTVYLENRPMDERSGFFAVTPLRLDDGSALLVQRGWLPRDAADRTHITAPPAPAGRVDVHGRIAPGLSRVYELGSAGSGAIRQNLDIEAYSRETALPLRPLAIVQEDPALPPDGLLRHWPQPAVDVNKHYGYAFQWFAMSGLAISLYAWFQIIRPRRRPSASRR